jgi:CheY-like chemotaxis protein
VLQKVLVVDDEPLLRQFASAHLKSLGYEVVCAASGPEALAVLEYDQEFALLFTDVVMPHMSGVELARRMRAAGHSMEVVTGYSKEVFDKEGPPEPGAVLLHKPYRRAQVADVLARLLGDESAEVEGA